MKKFFLCIAALCGMFTVNAGDYSNYGALQVLNNQLCDKDGHPVQLRGWSTHGPWHMAAYDDATDFQRMKNAGANIARIAMYLNEGHAYIDYPEDNIAWVKNCIDYCAAQNMYCIVDWHALKDRDGKGSSSLVSALTDPAPGFFSEISAYVKSRNYHHVLYEILNEPNKNIEGDPYLIGKEIWPLMKSYAETVLPVIKANDPNAVVIVGTPQWNTDLANPLTNPLDQSLIAGMNIMYAFHFYAGDQERYLGELSAASAFMPIFVSDWSVDSHTGGGSYDKGKPVTDKFLAVCNGLNLGGQLISWCSWSWSDKGDASAAFTNYANNQWSASGNYVKTELARGDGRFVYRQSSAYNDPQVFEGTNDLNLDLGAYNEGGQGHAYWDYDGDMTTTPGAYGYANMYGDFRTDDNVDIGYTNNDNPEDGYYWLSYILNPEWVEYTIDAKYAGDYAFEVFTNNYDDINIVAFTMDGKNCLYDNNGQEQKAVYLPPCHGGTSNSVGYNEWDWTKVQRVQPIAGEKFYLRIPSAGNHKLAIAFLTPGTGLGTIKLMGNEETAIEDIRIDSDKPVKVCQDGQLYILRDGKIFNATGAEIK